MHRTFAPFITTLAFIQAAQAGPIAQQVDAAIAPYFKPDAPGASVIVVQDGKVVFRKGYGLSDMAKGIPMDGSEQQRIGSITKQFTATAILMLAEEGKLALGDDITRFLPDYPTRGKKITIEHLLTHTSGVANFTSKPTFRYTMDKDMSVSGMIDTFKDDPLTFEPGSAYAYSNSGYFLLGAVIEKASGMSYADFVQQRIFTPLGMRDTAHEGHYQGSARRATGHGAGHGPSKAVSMTQTFSAGALLSTLDDLAKWNNAVASGKLLTPASWQRALAPARLPDGASTGYGFGWHIDTWQGSPRIAHGGGIPGHSAYVMRLPQEKLFVAVLANSDKLPFSTSFIGTRAAAAVLGKPLPEKKP